MQTMHIHRERGRGLERESERERGRERDREGERERDRAREREKGRGGEGEGERERPGGLADDGQVLRFQLSTDIPLGKAVATTTVFAETLGDARVAPPE